MCDLLTRLKPEQRTGSKPRCHQITHGTPNEVTDRLTSLMSGHGHVSADDSWMPRGFDILDEARLDQAQQLVKDQEHRQALKSWWLTVPEGANTPNWDIASTANIGGRPGFLLVEAKAHLGELKGAENGKKLVSPASFNSRRNHSRIGWCIEDASLALSDQTGRDWTLSRDSHYQMSNRFAWSWKLTQLGYPVILVYLGFLNANEMQVPFVGVDWAEKVKDHSSRLFPDSIWDSPLNVHGHTFVPIIQTLELPLCC